MRQNVNFLPFSDAASIFYLKGCNRNKHILGPRMNMYYVVQNEAWSGFLKDDETEYKLFLLSRGVEMFELQVARCTRAV